MGILNLSKFFKALSEPNRMRIFDHICRCQSRMNVKEVSSCCEVDLSVVSRHLTTLKNAGVLTAKKNGKEVFYSVDGKEIVKQLRDLADKIEKHSNQKCC